MVLSTDWHRGTVRDFWGPMKVAGRHGSTLPLSLISNIIHIYLIYNNYNSFIVAATRTAPASLTLHPDVLICDISSRRVDGIEIGAQAARACSGPQTALTSGTLGEQCLNCRDGIFW